MRGRVEKADPDFTVYYTAARIFRERRGAYLYTAVTQQSVQREFARDSDLRRSPLPYIHPPFEALIFVPLTWLSYSKAFLLWNGVNLLLLIVIAQRLRGSLHALSAIPLWEWVAALLAFFPVFANFLQGQDAILLLLVFVFGFRALERDALFLAGCWFGLGIFKYHFVLPLVLIVAVWKGRKFLSGFAATAIAMSLLSLALVGWQGLLRYPAYAWHVVSVPGYGQTPPGLMVNLMGLAAGWPKLQDLGWPVRVVALVASAALLIAVGGMRRTANDQRFFRLTFACAVLASLLVAYNTNAHDLCLLVLPLTLVGDHCAARWSDGKPAKALLIPITPLLISPVWIFLWMGLGKLNVMAILLLWWIYAMQREMVKLRSTASASLTVPA